MFLINQIANRVYKYRTNPKIPDDIISRQPLILFDGECNLCNYSVRFLIRHNRSANLSFASLQSKSGAEILAFYGDSAHPIDSIVLVENNLVYVESSAAVKIAVHLDFPWCMLKVFAILPTRFLDIVYRFIARNRYKWFGENTHCFPDGGEIKKRIIS